MSIYKRDPVFPEWEPMPWNMQDEAAVDEQERGFHERAQKPIVWQPLPRQNFPPQGLFGHSIEWFDHYEVAWVATFDGEHLLLRQATWHGFPDAPEWSLASISIGSPDNWSNWGAFPNLPAAWKFPSSLLF